MGVSGAFNHEYESALSITGLGDYDSIMDYVSGEVLVKSRTTSTVLVTLADGRRICLKRYWYPKAIVRYAVRRSRAAVEWENLGILGDIGLKTPVPVGWGEKREGAWLKGCFIMTAYLAGFTDLAEYSREHFTRPEGDASEDANEDASEDANEGAIEGAIEDADERRLRIVKALAELAKNMHAARFVNRAFFFRNLLFDPGAGEVDFYVIDSPKGYRTTSAIRLRKGQIEDIAAIYTDFKRFFADKDWDLFLETYFGGKKLSPRELAFVDDCADKARAIESRRARQDAAHRENPPGAVRRGG